jgi:parvulin-like peptidyl-prolyl isomerase
MAKRKVKQDISLTRKQVSRREKERRQRLNLIGVAVAIGCLILVILGFGVYQELVGKPAAPVAKVNGVPLSTNIYQKRVRLERMMLDANIEMMRTQRSLYDPEVDTFMLSIIDQQISQLSVQRDLLNTESFVDELIQEELIRQAAQEAGVSVSPQEIDRKIEQEFGYSGEEPTAVPSPSTDTITSTAEITPTEVPTPMTRARFEELYGDFLTNLKNGTGLTEAEYRDVVEVTLLRGKMEEYVGQQVPTSEPQIRVRHILLDTEEEAQAVLQRLEDGEDFAALATEVSTDTLSAELGGDLGWIPKGQMDTAFDEVAFNLPVGEISDVVETPRGFHTILVEDRDDDRELDHDILEQRRSDAFQVWLVDLEAEAAIERSWSADKVPPE